MGAALIVIACVAQPSLPPTATVLPSVAPSTPPVAVNPSSGEATAAVPEASVSRPSGAPRTAPPPGTLTRFETADLSRDSRDLTLHFVGGAPFSDLNPCSKKYAGWAEQVGDELQAAVVDVTPPTASICDDLGFGRFLAIRLQAPFAGSRLVDLAGYVHFLRPPDGQAIIRGLPAGWLLRSERDVEESPTGRWQRTYSRLPTPPEGTSRGRIDFYQSFGGPVGVTGGEEERTVTVNGQGARLYRFAPDGELVLVWSLGRDGFALVANENDLSVDQLILLAQSVAPG